MNATLRKVDLDEALTLLRGLYEPITMLGKHALPAVDATTVIETLDAVRNVVAILESARGEVDRG